MTLTLKRAYSFAWHSTPWYRLQKVEQFRSYLLDKTRQTDMIPVYPPKSADTQAILDGWGGPSEHGAHMYDLQISETTDNSCMWNNNWTCGLFRKLGIVAICVNVKGSCQHSSMVETAQCICSKYNMLYSKQMKCLHQPKSACHLD